jgi:hypothetical protein
MLYQGFTHLYYRTFFMCSITVPCMNNARGLLMYVQYEGITHDHMQSTSTLPMKSIKDSWIYCTRDLFMDSTYSFLMCSTWDFYSNWDFSMSCSKGLFIFSTMVSSRIFLCSTSCVLIQVLYSIRYFYHVQYQGPTIFMYVAQGFSACTFGTSCLSLPQDPWEEAQPTARSLIGPL